MKRTLIACAMVEDEIRKIYERTGCRIPVVWVERGYHNSPEELRKKLQALIDGLQDQDEILLTFGLCGNGTAGLVSPHATLILPRFDDCINMLLCRSRRETRGFTEAGSIYLTRAWTQDPEAILAQCDNYTETYGQEAAEEILETMYGNYERITVIDTGCYELTATQKYAQEAAERLNLSTETVTGSTRILEQLLEGQWDENFIVQRPGEMLSARKWEFPDRA